MNKKTVLGGLAGHATRPATLVAGSPSSDVGWPAGEEGGSVSGYPATAVGALPRAPDPGRRTPEPPGGLPGRTLLAQLGHELRTPLTGIVGLTRIMLTDLADGSAAPERQAQQLELVGASATELLRTLELIVSLARIDQAPGPAGGAWVDCRDAAPQVVAPSRAAAADRERPLGL